MNSAAHEAAFQAAASQTDKGSPSKYGPYSGDAARAQEQAIESGAWSKGEGSSIVKENEDDPDAPELAVDYYGRLTKSSSLKERHVSMAAKFGLPMSTTHLGYLKEEEEAEARRAILGAPTGDGGGGGGSVLSFDESHSLFLGGESLWSDTSAGITKLEDNIRCAMMTCQNTLDVTLQCICIHAHLTYDI